MQWKNKSFCQNKKKNKAFNYEKVPWEMCFNIYAAEHRIKISFNIYYFKEKL